VPACQGGLSISDPRSTIVVYHLLHISPSPTQTLLASEPNAQGSNPPSIVLKETDHLAVSKCLIQDMTGHSDELFASRPKPKLQDVLDRVHTSDIYPRTENDAPVHWWTADERVAKQHDDEPQGSRRTGDPPLISVCNTYSHSFDTQ
jgi:hypothetical protein